MKRIKRWRQSERSKKDEKEKEKKKEREEELFEKIPTVRSASNHLPNQYSSPLT